MLNSSTWGKPPRKAPPDYLVIGILLGIALTPVAFLLITKAGLPRYLLIALGLISFYAIGDVAMRLLYGYGHSKIAAVVGNSAVILSLLMGAAAFLLLRADLLQGPASIIWQFPG